MSLENKIIYLMLLDGYEAKWLLKVMLLWSRWHLREKTISVTAPRRPQVNYSFFVLFFLFFALKLWHNLTVWGNKLSRTWGTPFPFNTGKKKKKWMEIGWWCKFFFHFWRFYFFTGPGPVLHTKITEDHCWGFDTKSGVFNIFKGR